MAHKALLVEDEPMCRMVLERHLRRAGFSQTVVAENGYEALNELPADEMPSVIFTDLHMPDIDGVNLVSFLRQRSEFAKTPIVAVTADSADSRDWVADGFSDYLGKPVSYDKLEAVLIRLGLLVAHS